MALACQLGPWNLFLKHAWYSHFPSNGPGIWSILASSSWDNQWKGGECGAARNPCAAGEAQDALRGCDSLRMSNVSIVALCSELGGWRGWILFDYLSFNISQYAFWLLTLIRACQLHGLRWDGRSVTRYDMAHHWSLENQFQMTHAFHDKRTCADRTKHAAGTCRLIYVPCKLHDCSWFDPSHHDRP